MRRASWVAALAVLGAGLVAGSQRECRAQWIKPSPTLEKTVKALDSPTSLEFIETPLDDVVEYLKSLHGIPIAIDQPALQQAKISSGVGVTQFLKGVSLRSALTLMLRQIGLTYTVRSDGLLITTPKEAVRQLVTNVYPIGDLAEPAGAGAAGRLDPATLTRAITANVRPSSWWSAGGRGTIAALPPGQPKYLVITQNGSVQDEVADLLGRLGEAAAGRPALRDTERKVFEALKSPTTLEFIETPLLDVVDYLKDLHGIEVQLDYRPMAAAGITGEAAITENLKGVSLEAALQRILRKLNLGYVVQDETLLVTTANEAQRRRLVAVYPVDAAAAARLAPGAKQPGAQAVIEKITTTIAPPSWRRSGGRGTIAAVTWGKRSALIVSQTFGVQQQIAKLLEPPPAPQPKPTKAEPPKTELPKP